ncbi:MAG: phosphoribosylformylglycinamidine synthase subunit PurL [Ignavibacteriales bacterium]|nr:phosphoribosylformylglycinamidine synthase subunit PurL [Ignavibacteriales bacterium]
MNIQEPEVTVELAIKHGLTKEEYEEILKILNRTPTYTELGIYSVMWSEHCSYKNSIQEIKKLPRTGERLLVEAGEENAGLIDIGDGLAVAFKIESHNHPSAVEPYQGAATGVGGIMRDIFTMGARPIAALNSLRFGNPSHPRTKYLMKRIVQGIGDYGNSFGVPTVAGDVYFDDCYNENPIVNAMSVGIVKHSLIAKSAAKGVGNLVMIVGSSTGRDGIHGATFASEEISEESDSKRPSVQVGDPFTEKLLLEATLEAIKENVIVGIQDMGAAGITCSTSEMSARGGTGMKINLDDVPVREKAMSGYEIMLSESQERMLMVVKPKDEIKVKEIFQKWDLQCETIGEVTNNGNVEIYHHGNKIAEVSAFSLVLGGGAPVYTREATKPKYIDECRDFDINALPEPSNYNQVILKMIGSLNLCSRGWISKQYDAMVRTNTISYGGDSAVVRIKSTIKALAMKTDCNARYIYLNPYLGAEIAVAECARNLVCSGAKPLAITNCLNFGNPYKPEIYWQFKEVIRGIGDACRFLGTPVTGGNVSFYNENPTGAIYPTPVIGMIGEIEDYSKTISQAFKNPEDLIILLGENKSEVGGSEYLNHCYGLVKGEIPRHDLDSEKRLHNLILNLNQEGLLNSAHDVSDGGMLIAICESIIHANKNSEVNLGAEIHVKTGDRLDYYLFSESQSMVVVSCSPDKLNKLKSQAEFFSIQFNLLGKVTRNKKLIVNDIINIEIQQIGDLHEKRMEELFIE